MAAITFSYRSKKDKANLEVRLSFRIKGKNLHPVKKVEMPFSFYTRTQIEVEKKFWHDIKDNVNFNSKTKKDKRKDILKDIDELTESIEAAFKKAKPETINKAWFKNTVENHYNPKPDKEQTIPTDILGFFGYYLDFNEVQIKRKSINTWRNWKVIEGKLQKFLNGKVVQLKDVNAKFRDKWQKHFFVQGYAATTIKKDFRYIKQVCAEANEYDIETYHAIDKLEVKLEDEAKDLPIVYLTFDELKKINAVENLPPYLDNAKDWLLISCFTGQRISDFMRFEKSMIFYKDGKPFIEIRQKKTGKEVSIPLLEPVLNILEKRKGDFPKPISDQRYNDYIKEVAKLAGLDEVIRGRLKIDNRRVIGNYPKWKLISSHTGRRSFASNFYKKINIVTLKRITGHYREDTFLTYIGEKTDKADAKDYEAMAKVNINI